MSTKRPTVKAKTVSPPPSSAPPKPGPVKAKTSFKHTIRETVESIVIAFVLAFLFRTFEAEAFVIPTGSMAPTLQGRHKDIVCPECGYNYRVSASSEEREAPAPQDVVAASCPLCDFRISVDPREAAGRKWPSYSGDRILVGKFPFDFSDPERFDVVVFRYPDDAKMNYIKRMVGLPRETVRIYHGDIYTRPRQEEHFAMIRKPLDKVRPMAQMVYDTDYAVDELTQAGWPLRWQPWHGSSGATAWETADRGRSYAVAGGSSDDAWIRYQHLVPTEETWTELERFGALNTAPRPRLITDACAYNSFEERGMLGRIPNPGLHWVGDLMIDLRLEVQAGDGMALLDLVQGGRHFQCEIDVSTGRAHLSIDGVAEFQPEADTPVKGIGSHDVVFANFDHQLLLWVDGRLITFDGPTTFPDLGNDLPMLEDLAPVGIGTRGAALRVSHVRVKRDIYYIAWKRQPDNDHEIREHEISDYDWSRGKITFMNRRDFREFFGDPQAWEASGLFELRRHVDFPLEADQFLALGDNSPESSDSRFWPLHYVDRSLLIGKALYIYWPHSLNRIPYVNIPFPFFPNFKDMGFVR